MQWMSANTMFKLGMLLCLITVSTGCGATPPRIYHPRARGAKTEAQLFEAAKRHPNATPRVRPLFPDQAPPGYARRVPWL